jgi:hypothetical protein
MFRRRRRVIVTEREEIKRVTGYSALIVLGFGSLFGAMLYAIAGEPFREFWKFVAGLVVLWPVFGLLFYAQARAQQKDDEEEDGRRERLYRSIGRVRSHDGMVMTYESKLGWYDADAGLRVYRATL